MFYIKLQELEYGIFSKHFSIGIWPILIIHNRPSDVNWEHFSTSASEVVIPFAAYKAGQGIWMFLL